MRTDQFSNDYHPAHISSIYYLHSYQSLAMPLKGRDTPADRPRNELEEEEETVQTLQYSQDQVHHSGTAARPMPNGEVGVSRLPRRRREMEKYMVQYRKC